jgi:hypothetical protein
MTKITIYIYLASILSIVLLLISDMIKYPYGE